MADFVAEENKDVGNKSSQVAAASASASAEKKRSKEKKRKKVPSNKKNNSNATNIVVNPKHSKTMRIKNPMDTIIEYDNESDDSNVNKSKKVQKVDNENPSRDNNPHENQTEPVVLEKRIKPQPKPIPEPKDSWVSKTISNMLTSKHLRETPYPSAPYIKNAVMIYDTIDEAINTDDVKYPYTKSFAQTKKKRNWFESITNSDEKQELQESKDKAEKDAKELVDELLKINFDDIKADHRLIIELHIKIQDVEGGPKAYITKLENDAMNMIGGKRGKRTRRKRQPVQKGGNNDDMEKKKKKLKIVNILKQLNSANYIDYEIESIIQELKRLLGQPSTVDTSIPKTIETTTTIQEDMYSEPLPICTDKDKNSNETCKKNRKKLENRLKYFNILKELNAMHNDNALLAVAQSVIEENKENIKAYYKPYAKSDDTTTNKADKDEQYLATLKKFTPIDKKDSTLDTKITKYNEIVKELNGNKEHIVNPQLNEKLMTTNTKQTVTQSSSFKNILGVENVLNMIGSFNMDEYQSTYGNANNMGDPGHTKTSSSSVVKSTDILRNKEPENNVEAK